MKNQKRRCIPLKERRHLPALLFFAMLQISAFTFGGGFVIMSLMKKRFVDREKLLTEDEMLDMIAIAQAAPGPIAVNAAILAGRRIAGAKGAAAAVLGTVLPPMVTLGLISMAYEAFAGNAWVQAVLKGMQAGAAAVVADVAVGLGRKTAQTRDAFNLAVMAVAFLAVMLGVPVLGVILAAIAAGVVRVLLQRKEVQL